MRTATTKDRARVRLDAACNKLGVLLEFTNSTVITEPTVKTTTEPNHASYFVPATWDLDDATARLPHAHQQWLAGQSSKVCVSFGPQRLDDENAGHLPELIRECERLGYDLHLTYDPAVDLPELKDTDGRRTLIARADQVGVALDDVRLTGRCFECARLLDEKAVLFFPANALPSFRAFQDLAGGDSKICRPCFEASGLPLTAAQRGTEWLARWGCPGLCIVEHGTPTAYDCHSTLTAETSLLAADVDSSGYSANGEDLPWMTAQVIVHNDRPQAYGRQTQVWLGYGVHLAELSPAEARKALDAMRGFVGKLARVVSDAEALAKDDFAGDPEIARLDTEATDRRFRTVNEDSQ